jgi:5'-deoxynucleotidase YfbR-like HD superfamily hydrolase
VFLATMPASSHSSARAWQRMLSGRRLDILSPSPLDIEIDDIAHGLARVARWNGQTSGKYGFSVAQHSVLVEQILSLNAPQLAQKWHLACLLHDAPEYVIGDMITPFKAAIGTPYKKIESLLQEAVHIRFGLPAELPIGIAQSIKRADRMAAYLEATELAGFSDTDAGKLFPKPRGTPKGIDLTPLSPEKATRSFLQRFDVLFGRNGPAR